MRRAWAMAWAMAWICTGCGSGTSTIPAPNLTNQVERVQAQSKRMQLILAVMDADLARAKSARARFFEVARERYAAPFPLDLFKQTAMSCLNQSLELDERPEPDAPPSEAQRALAAQGVSLSCAPESLGLLVQTVQAQSALNLALVATQLARVDTMRVTRGKVRTRTSKLGPLLVQQRLFLDRERLELRRLRRRVTQRRDDYDDATLKRARARLTDLQLKLNQLDERIRVLEAGTNRWREDFQTELRAFYFDLAALYITDPFEDEGVRTN